VGGYGLDVARTLDELAADFAVLPMADAARAAFTCRDLTAEEARELSFGRRIPTAPGVVGTTTAPVAAFAPDGTLVALLADEGDGDGDGGRSRPVLVLAPA
jgi:tRNA pseudouridine55 synthase